MNINLLTIFLFTFVYLSSGQQIVPRELRCLVCKRAVDLIEKEIDKMDPKKKVEIGNYRLDHKGDLTKQTVELRRSELYLTELMEEVCNKMDDFVRARLKKNGKLIVMPLFEGGSMNPLMSEVDIVQDGDLNKSLKFYCQGILEEFEEGFIESFQNTKPDDNRDIKLCSGVAKLCDETVDEEYAYEHEDL